MKMILCIGFLKCRGARLNVVMMVRTPIADRVDAARVTAARVSRWESVKATSPRGWRGTNDDDGIEAIFYPSLIGVPG